MRITELINYLNGLPEELKDIGVKLEFITPFWKRLQLEAALVNPPVLSFEEAGKVIRIMKKALGSPLQNYTSDYCGRGFKCRKVVYNRVYRCVYPHRKQVLKLRDSGKVMETYHGYVVVHIPKNCFVSQFYNSNKPEDWKREQKKIKLRVERMKKVKAVVKALDKAGNVDFY